jgi:hypothetical protein
MASLCLTLAAALRPVVEFLAPLLLLVFTLFIVEVVAVVVLGPGLTSLFGEPEEEEGFPSVQAGYTEMALFISSRMGWASLLDGKKRLRAARHSSARLRAHSSDGLSVLLSEVQFGLGRDDRAMKRSSLVAW